MAYEGAHKVTKDYIQPLLKAAAVVMPVLLFLEGRQRTAVLVGGVYLALHLLASYASRHAGALVERAGSERQGAQWLWAIGVGAFGIMTAGMLLALPAIAIAAFVVLAIAQNFWRPIMIGRIADQAQATNQATVLSVESQAKSLFAAVLAPLLGLAVDLMPAKLHFLPVAVSGLGISAWMLLSGRLGRHSPEAEPT
ncbi:MAG: hypothetical protein ACYTF6_03745 [Planctomycetota bacterium]|jgi:hypothetical protein